MRYSRVVEAQKEAQRFIERADKLLNSNVGDESDFVDNRTLSGAVRRASLDLTRALSFLRKSDYLEG